MLVLKKPEPQRLKEYLARQESSSFSYAELGATSGVLPVGYAVNHTRKELGRGQTTFDCACTALASWQQMQLGWVACWPQTVVLKQGETFAVIGRAFGLWWINACRIVYLIDDRVEGAKFGYAHGTLVDHVARGEERFLIEMCADGTVWIDILAFSRPNTLAARIGYPLMRRAQRRFGLDATAKLLQVIQAER